MNATKMMFGQILKQVLSLKDYKMYQKMVCKSPASTSNKAISALLFTRKIWNPWHLNTGSMMLLLIMVTTSMLLFNKQR